MRMDHSSRSTSQLTISVGLIKSMAGSAHAQQLELIAELDTRRVWRSDGAKSMAQWVAAHFGVTHFTAQRWISAGRALAGLPRVRRALSTGHLSLDKTVELTRLATAETEVELLAWARRVSAGAIRRKADLAQRDDVSEVRDDDTGRSLQWWFEEGKRMWLEGYLPAEQGALVAAALERMADGLPGEPGVDAAQTANARRADALVMMCSGEVASDPSPARAAVSLHVDLDALRAGGSAELEGRGALHPSLAAMLCCDSRVQAVLHDSQGHIVGLGRTTRNVPEWLKRHLRQRDGDGCTFPGCHHKRYVDGHHIWPWEWGGPTDFGNLTLVCRFHHKLIHVYGWRVALGKRPGIVYWFRPNGRLYEPGGAVTRAA